MPGETPKVIVHSEQLMIPGNRQGSDKAVGAGRCQANGQTLVSEAGCLDVIPRAWIDDAERRQEPPLQICKLLLVPDAAEDLLEHHPGETQGPVPGHQLLDYFLDVPLLRTHASTAEHPRQHGGIQENHRRLRSFL